jgi:hypothetical protein
VHTMPAHAHTHTHTHAHPTTTTTHIHTHTSQTGIHTTSVHPYIHTYIHTRHIRANTLQVSVLTYIHTHTYIHTYMHIAYRETHRAKVAGKRLLVFDDVRHAAVEPVLDVKEGEARGHGAAQALARCVDQLDVLCPLLVRFKDRFLAAAATAPRQSTHSSIEGREIEIKMHIKKKERRWGEDGHAHTQTTQRHMHMHMCRY